VHCARMRLSARRSSGFESEPTIGRVALDPLPFLLRTKGEHVRLQYTTEIAEKSPNDDW